MKRLACPELGAIAKLVFVVLAWGGAAGPHPWDVGELVAAAARLGGSHAPGQPLHALCGHAIAWLPIGSIVLRVSWLSALGAAVVAYATGRTVHALADREGAEVRVAAAFAALAVAFTPAVLRSAMRPEVYALALACVMLGAWALAERARGDRHGLRLAAIFAGLAVALHPPHALALAAMALLACVSKRPSRVEMVSSIGLGLVVTLALVAYLPIRALAGAPMWGEPTTAHGLWAYLSGAAYRGNLGSGPRDAILVAQYLVLGGGGVVLLAFPLALRDRSMRAPWAIASVAIVAALLQPFEERNPDNVAYDAPAIALSIVAAAASLARAPRWRWAALALPIVPLCASSLGGSLASADLPALETLAFETLSAPGPRALLITRSDFVSGAVMLGRDVDRLRPDVAHFVEGLATSSWHWRSLAGHPAFDGAPHRGEGSDAHHAYVRGALDHARGHVEIAVENATLLADHGALRGALSIEASDRVDDRATAERTMGAIASSLAWAEHGDHEIGAQIVRDVVSRRAPLLFAREHGAQARSELSMAAPDARDDIAHLGDGPFDRSAAIVIRDPAYALSAREDVVRLVAVLLDRRGSSAATTLLAAQQARGDDLAIAQLAAIELERGLIEPARTSFAAFRARRPDVRSPELDTLAAALR